MAKLLFSKSSGRLESERPRLSLRTHLVLLVLAAVLPLLIFGAVMFWRDVQLQRAGIEQGMRATAHALSLAFDREVGITQGVLETLAASTYLDVPDFEAFYRLCRTVVENRKDSRIILFDRSGHQIMNTGFRFGDPLPNPLRDATPSKSDPSYPELPLGGPDSVKAVIETGRSVVSDLFVGLSTREPHVVVGVPVQRGGEVLYVLEMSLGPQALRDLLMEQQLPSDWFASIMDRKGMIIARTRDPRFFVGRPATAEQVELMANSDGGWGTRPSLEGGSIEYAFTRSKITGWTTDVAVPQAVLYDPVDHSVRLMAVGAGLLVLLALGAALALGRRVSTPIQSLAGSAEAIQRGEHVELKPSAVREVTELHSAMLEAAETSRQLATERERSAVTERFHRLAEISATLAESIDFEKTLARLADLLVPDHADWCFIDLLQDRSSVCRRVAVRTSRKDKQHFADEFFHNYPPDLSHPHPILKAVQTGETDYNFNPESSWPISRSRDERHLFLLQQMEMNSVIIVPLRVHGRVAGAFSLVLSKYSGRKYSMADVEFAEEVSRRASVALDNAWLHREVQQELAERKQTERRRNAHFAITQILAESPSLDVATPRILQTVGETLGWQVGQLWIPDADNNVLRCLKVWHDGFGAMEGFVSARRERTLHPGLELPGHVWRSLKPVWLSDITRDENISSAPLAVEAGLHAGFAFPILFGERFLGVMEFFSRDTREPDLPMLAMFGSVGSQIGQFMERKRAEDALREADRRKDEFLAMFGHELRNPLGVINTVVQLLRIGAPLEARVEEFRKTIEEQVAQMARLLDDLLDVSRIARGMIRLRKERCDFAAIVRQVAENHRPLLEESGLNLTAKLPEQSVWVTGDRTRLAQIVGNLLYNANKFTDQGGQVDVHLTEEQSTTSALLTIRDTGVGMEPETLAHVFEPFVQADKSLDRTRGGLGLGLAIVKGLVDLHEGEVWALSEGLGLGSAVTVRLPLAEAAYDTENARPLVASRPCRILLIEDNRAAAQSLQMFLSKLGHRVEVALNGRDGVSMAGRIQPEVVICDIGLPGLDGYGVAQAVRQEPQLKGAYLIALSGYGQEEHRQRAAAAGFDQYLTKPVDLADLQRLLARLTLSGRPAA